MHVEYHKWFSPCLGHDMEIKVYGHYGKPVLVFPAQSGRFYEFEDFGMIAACQSWIDMAR
jgi:esterase/lipase superfamily enzyme